MDPIVHKFIHSFKSSFVHSKVHLFIQKFIHSFKSSFIHSKVHSILHQFIQIIFTPSIHPGRRRWRMWMRACGLPRMTEPWSGSSLQVTDLKKLCFMAERSYFFSFNIHHLPKAFIDFSTSPILDIFFKH